MYLNGVVTTFRLDATDGGGKDMVFSTAERGVVSWFTMDMTPKEWLAYTFNWRQMALDFGIGVGVDFLMDGVTDFFKGRNAARAVDGITDEMSDALGDGAAREMRESMEDIVGDGAERTVRESAEEAAEWGTRDATGELVGEYDDFSDDIKEL